MSGHFPPELPYVWRPDGAYPTWDQRPTPEALVGWRHAVWRVIEVTVEEREADPGRLVGGVYHLPGPAPYVVVLRPAGRGDDVRDRDHDVHARFRGYTSWYVYEDEHYPVCVVCREPSPCRARMAARHSDRAAKAAAEVGGRAEMGACTACGEPVSSRQRTIEFPGLNLESPSAPAPVFHLRAQCWGAAHQYEKKWVPAGLGRTWRLECPGKTRRHADAWDCTEGPLCPGSDVLHRDRTVCDDSSVRCLRCADARTTGQVAEKLPGDPEPPRRRPRRKPAGLSGYVIPAAKLGAVPHIADGTRPADPPKPVKVQGRVVVAQFPPGAILGYTVCGLEMLADDLWVPYRADPAGDGSLCGDCGSKAHIRPSQTGVA